MQKSSLLNVAVMNDGHELRSSYIYFLLSFSRVVLLMNRW